MSQHSKQETWNDNTTLDYSMLRTENAPDFGTWVTLDILKASGGKDELDGMPRTLVVRKRITKEARVEEETTQRYLLITPDLLRLSNVLSMAHKRNDSLPSTTKIGHSGEIIGGYLSKLVRLIVDPVKEESISVED